MIFRPERPIIQYEPTYASKGLSATTILEANEETASSSAARRSFLLVFSCTLIGALAQILIKQGHGQLGAHVTLADVAHHPALFVSSALE